MSELTRATERFAAGGIVLVGDAHRTFAAAPADAVAGFTVERLTAVGGGTVLLALDAMLADELTLPDGVPIDAAWGISGGTSAEDRARTIHAAAARSARRTDLITPGHVHHLRAAHGDAAHAAVHLAHESGHTRAVALSAVLDATGAPVAPWLVRRDARRAHLPLLLAADVAAVPLPRS